MNFKKIKNSFEQLAIEWRIVLFVFTYVLFAGLVLQKIVLPLTPWHAGQGLLVGGDWILFQEVALTHAAQIREFGWGEFLLKPEGHGPSGLAAFVYAATGVNQPWVLLPVHGAVYAVAALGLFWIVQAVGGSTRLALYALLPMVMMPSLSMVWGQLHKDVWAIAAVLLILAFWARLLVGQRFKFWAALLLLSFANASLLWMRPYTLQIVLVGQFLMALVLIYVCLKNKKIIILWFACAALLLSFTFFKLSKLHEIHEIHGVRDAHKVQETSGQFCKQWEFSSNLIFIDKVLSSLACTRDNFFTYSKNAKSNLDSDVSYKSVADVVAYTPRALQVGVLAPFPNMWFTEGTKKTSHVFKLVASVETFVMYVAFLGLCLLVALMLRNQAGLRFEQNMAITALMLFSMVWVGVYALVSGNVGTIYRVRFPIMLLWMGVGLLAWYRVLAWWRARVSVVHD